MNIVDHRSILVSMSVAGHDMYFDFASYSIPSFLNNCKGVKLIVFTDNVSKLEKYKDISDNLIIADFNKAFQEHKKNMPNVIAKSLDNDKVSYGDYNHNHILVSSLLPMAHYEALNMDDIQYIIKVDCDGYFAGENMIESVAKDISKVPDYDLYLVDRTHKWMGLFGKGLPGVGFTMWKKNGNFIKEYNNLFDGNEQGTIVFKCFINKKVKTNILLNPAYHFVFPFHPKHMKKKRNFVKQDLEQFLPAYFHVHKIEELQKMKLWFG